MAGKSVIVDFDFAVANGAEILFETAKGFLKELDGIKLDESLEARYLAGNGYEDGFSRLFAVVKTKKTAPKAAREFAAAFARQLTDAVPKAVGPAAKNFIKALVEKGVRLVIATRADPEAVRAALAFVPDAQIAFYQEVSDCYGGCWWDTWLRAARNARLDRLTARALAGTGFAVRSALRAGFGTVAVVSPHVAYQDFGGADAILDELSGKSVRKLLEVLRIQ